MFFQRARQSAHRNVRNGRTPFNNAMQSIRKPSVFGRVNAYARSNPFLNNDVRNEMQQVNSSLKQSAMQYHRQDTGLKDNYVESQLTHRIVGRDAMLQARVSERKNEHNELKHSVPTVPHQFTRREMKVIEDNVMQMEEEKPTVTMKRVIPINEPKYESVKGNTDVKMATKYKSEAFTAKPTQSDDLKNVVVPKNARGKKRNAPSALNIHAPVLNETQTDYIAPNLMRHKMIAKTKIATMLKDKGSKRRKYRK